MNAFKKYLRRKGIKLEQDYPYLPYGLQGKSCFDPGCIIIEAVKVNAEEATVTTYLNVIVDKVKVNRNGSLENIWEEE